MEKPSGNVGLFFFKAQTIIIGTGDGEASFCSWGKRYQRVPGIGRLNGPIDARGYRSNVGLALIMFLVGIKVGLRLST